MRTVGVFAFGGWAIVTGVLVAFFFVGGLLQGSSILSNIPWLILELLFGGAFGIVAGGAVGAVALLLQRLLKRPNLNAAPDSANAAPDSANAAPDSANVPQDNAADGIWPPAIQADRPAGRVPAKEQEDEETSPSG